MLAKLSLKSGGGGGAAAAKSSADAPAEEAAAEGGEVSFFDGGNEVCSFGGLTCLTSFLFSFIFFSNRTRKAMKKVRKCECLPGKRGGRERLCITR